MLFFTKKLKNEILKPGARLAFLLPAFIAEYEENE